MEKKIKIKNMGDAPINAGINLDKYFIPAHGEAWVPVGVYEMLMDGKSDIQVVGLDIPKNTIPKGDRLIVEPI